MIKQDLEALDSFTDPNESFAAHTWLSFQPGFLFPWRTEHF